MTEKEPHAIQRARERYGINLTRDDLSTLKGRIAAGEGVLVAKTDDGGKVWMIKTHGVVARVAVSRMGSVTTFLPPDGPPISRGSGRIKNGSYSQRKHQKMERRKDRKFRKEVA